MSQVAQRLGGRALQLHPVLPLLVAPRPLQWLWKWNASTWWKAWHTAGALPGPFLSPRVPRHLQEAGLVGGQVSAEAKNHSPGEVQQTSGCSESPEEG